MHVIACSQLTLALMHLGVGWGELLARDRRCHTPLNVPNSWKTVLDGSLQREPSIALSLVEPQSSISQEQFLAPDYLYSSIRRVHPLGKEAKFSTSLRGAGSGLTSNYKVKARAKPQQKAWDSSFAVMQCSPFDPSASATALRNEIYKEARQSRSSFTIVPARGITKGWEKPPKSSERILRSVDENAKISRERSLDTPSFSLTGGTFAMSCQLAVSCRLPRPKAKHFTSQEIRQMHSEIYGSDGEEGADQDMHEDLRAFPQDDDQDDGVDDRMDAMMGDVLKQVFSPEKHKNSDGGEDRTEGASDEEVKEQEGAQAAEGEQIERGRTRERRAT